MIDIIGLFDMTANHSDVFNCRRQGPRVPQQLAVLPDIHRSVERVRHVSNVCVSVVLFLSLQQLLHFHLLHYRHIEGNEICRLRVPQSLVLGLILFFLYSALSRVCVHIYALTILGYTVSAGRALRLSCGAICQSASALFCRGCNPTNCK